MIRMWISSVPACRKPRTNVLYAALLRTELVDKCLLKCLCIVNLSETALSIARSEIKKGAQEVGGNNRGPFVAKYLQPSGLRPPQPWCAAFVSWCLLSASKKLGLTPLPYFVSAREMFNWAKASGYVVDLQLDAWFSSPGAVCSPGRDIAESWTA